MGCCAECDEKATSGDSRTDARFWNTALLSAAAVALLLTKGGNVTAKTRKMLNVAIAGALVAVVSDALIRPNVKI